MTPQPVIAPGTPVKTLTNRPTQKVLGATVATAAVEILVWAFNTYVSPANPIPPGIAGSINVVAVFLAGYFIPPSPADDIVPA
jgi:hypothetical protein